eukprot:4968884-Pyramimonas_sp.AAC.1
MALWDATVGGHCGPLLSGRLSLPGLHSRPLPAGTPKAPRGPKDPNRSQGPNASRSPQSPKRHPRGPQQAPKP